MSVKLGDYVVDHVSGFRGVVIIKHMYLLASTRCTVATKMSTHYPQSEEVTFDEGRLQVLGTPKLVEGSNVVSLECKKV